MKRRKFIRNLGLGTAATIGVPYLLPSGRLFAASGVEKSKSCSVLFVCWWGKKSGICS